MSLWPRSLFYRNLFLIVGLILLGQLASVILLREAVVKPRVALAAQTTARHVLAVARGLGATPAAARQDFVERYNAQARPDEADDRQDPTDETRHLTPLERQFVRQVSAQLKAQGAEVLWRREQGGVMAVRLVVEGVPYWVVMPGLIPAHSISPGWLLGSAGTALLAIFGAWLIQRRINRPLQNLVTAAGVLGRGEQPPVLPTDGPTEIATVSRSFNDMVNDLVRHEHERVVMLAGLSHDLRTPLTKMRLVSEMLGGQGDPTLLASLNRNIDTLDGLLGQFLDFTRASQVGGWGAEPLVDADLNDLVSDVVQVCTGQASGPLDVCCDLAGVAPQKLPIQTVRRMVLNLLSNAQRYGAPPIEVATGPDGPGWWLEVRDRGPGIPEDQREALKAPFARGDAARGEVQGAGLGLAIVDRMARAYGADFELLPREGGGLVARLHWNPDRRQG